MADTPDLTKFLPEDAQEDKILTESVKSFEEEVLADFNDSIERILNLRDPETIDKEFLVLALEQIGMTMDLVDLFTEEELRRLFSVAKDYFRVSGHENFIRVIGWALDAHFDMIPLFTEDYEEFKPEDEFVATTQDLSGDEIYEQTSGLAYQTNHVELKYDAIRFTDVEVQNVTSLFYQTAPIQVVLDSVTAQAVADTVTINTAAGGYLRITEPAKTKFPDIDVLAETLEVGAGALGYVRHIRNGFVLV